MRLSVTMKKEFVDEIRFVIENMQRTSDPAEKLYFFSGIYGAAMRICNIEFDPELVFIHNVTQTAYNTINGRLIALSQGLEKGPRIPDSLFSKLEQTLDEMLDTVEEGEETHSVLQRIANLAFSTTGNGYYLYLKGMLSI